MGAKAERKPRRTVGRPLARVDGPAKAAGTAVYPQDLPAPLGCLHAVTVRAPIACARIRKIDTSAAARTPGVVRVLTAADVRGTNRFGLLEPDQSVLADEIVRGASDVLAVVVADSEAAAHAGARRVGLDLEASTLLTDPEHALDADAPVIHPERALRALHPNVVAERELRRGDAERALARSHVIVTGEYRTPFVEHAFLAPEAGIASHDDDGGLTLHVATQWPEQDLRQAVAALGEPRGKLRIVQQTIGGAFGGREDVSLQILLLLAARATGKPVRMIWGREDSVRAHGKRHPFRIRHRLGADAAGRLSAVSIDVLVDAGCYASSSEAVLDNAVSQACGPYAARHVHVRARAVYTNNPYTCAFRGFGVNQMAFALEQQMNKLAAALAIDPAAARQRNFVAPGARLANGTKLLATARVVKTLRAAVARGRRRKLPEKSGDWRYGRGIAAALKIVGYGFGESDRATANVTLTPSGAVVRIGAAEVGQGIETILTQITADALSIVPSRVQVLWRDSRDTPEAGSSSASRQTLVSGNAVRRACELARGDLDRRGGWSALPEMGVTRSFTFRAPPTHPLGSRANGRHAYAYTWSACVADVRVDIATGRVEVLRVTTALDPGRVVNPKLLEGQVEGGAVMGQGYGLQERCVLRDAMPVTLGFDACVLPTSVDAAPEITTIVLESAEPAGPFGARGAGEITMIPVVPALTAAIHDAAGIWVDEIPATPDRVLAALATPRAR